MPNSCAIGVDDVGVGAGHQRELVAAGDASPQRQRFASNVRANVLLHELLMPIVEHRARKERQQFHLESDVAFDVERAGVISLREILNARAVGNRIESACDEKYDHGRRCRSAAACDRGRRGLNALDHGRRRSRALASTNLTAPRRLPVADQRTVSGFFTAALLSSASTTATRPACRDGMCVRDSGHNRPAVRGQAQRVRRQCLRLS